jgi:acyl-CoA dehydrogenase
MPYRAPSDIRFILDHVVGFAEVAATPRFAEATPDTGRGDPDRGRAAFDRHPLAPLNRMGDLHIRRGWKTACALLARLCRGLSRDCRGRLGRHGRQPGHGGMGLPMALNWRWTT